MKARCSNPNHPLWSNYGGRGITVCDRWRDSFAAFLDDMGERPEGPPRYTLDRIDNDGPYSPENCRWATYAKQTRNKRSNVVLTAFGRTMVLQDWASEVGLHPETLRGRISSGWPVEDAVTLPLGSRRRRAAA